MIKFFFKKNRQITPFIILPIFCISFSSEIAPFLEPMLQILLHLGSSLKLLWEEVTFIW